MLRIAFFVIGILIYLPQGLCNDIAFHQAYSTAKKQPKSFKNIIRITPSVNSFSVTDRTPASPTQLIHLNTATIELLQAVPGMDSQQAEIILQYRDELIKKRFDSLEQLLEIKGINVERLQQIRAHVVL